MTLENKSSKENIGVEKRLFQDFSRFCKRSQSVTEHERRHHERPTERKFRSVSCDPSHCQCILERKEAEKRRSRTSFVVRGDEAAFLCPAAHDRVEEDDDESEKPIATSPQGRFLKFSTEIGRGAFKTVFKGLDTETGVAVAWCEIQEKKWRKSETQRFHEEAEILKNLHHANIVRFYDYFMDSKNKLIVLVTELMTSGTLRTYIKRFKKINLKLMKNWSRQILKGLNYLHSQTPPVIHRDLKCDNIFITGASGLVKIGDLGLATLKKRSFAKSVIGTPEFMAPEMYEERYDESVDIYAFGMCLLEMATSEYPYKECASAAAIYRKVINGVKPESFKLVENQDLRNIISGCIRPDTNERYSVQQLLRLEFFLDEVAVKVELVPGEQQPADMSVIKFQLRIVDAKKRRTKLGENEAIQFAFHTKTDKPEAIVSELVGSKFIDEEDKLLVTKRIADLAKKELIRREDERKKNEEAAQQAKQAAEQHAQQQQQIQAQQQQQAQIQQQQLQSQQQNLQNQQQTVQQQTQFYQQQPQLHVQMDYQPGMENHHQIAMDQQHVRSCSQGFIQPMYSHGMSMGGMEVAYWPPLGHPHNSMTSVPISDQSQQQQQTQQPQQPYVQPATTTQVVFVPSNPGFYYGQPFYPYHYTPYPPHPMAPSSLSTNSTPAGSYISLLSTPGFHEDRRQSAYPTLSAPPEAEFSQGDQRASLTAASSVSSLQSAPGQPTQNGSSKAIGLPPRPSRRLSSQAALTGGVAGKLPQRTPSSCTTRPVGTMVPCPERSLSYDTTNMESQVAQSELHQLILHQQQQQACDAYEADSDSESMSECTMTEQELEQFRRSQMRPSLSKPTRGPVISGGGPGHHRSKRLQGSMLPLELEVVESGDEFVTCKLVQEGEQSSVRSVTLKVYPVSANAEEIARELIRMRYLSKSSRLLFLQKLEGIIEKFKAPDELAPREGEDSGHNDDVIGEIVSNVPSASSGVCVTAELQNDAAIASDSGSNGSAPISVPGAGNNLLTLASSSMNGGVQSSSAPTGATPIVAGTLDGAPNVSATGGGSQTSLCRTPMSPGASSTGSGSRASMTRPSFELIDIEQHRASSLGRGQLKGQGSGRHHRPQPATIIEAAKQHSLITATDSGSDSVDASTQTSTAPAVVAKASNSSSITTTREEAPSVVPAASVEQEKEKQQVDHPAVKSSVSIAEKKVRTRSLVVEDGQHVEQQPPPVVPAVQVPPTVTSAAVFSTTSQPIPIYQSQYSSSSSLGGTPISAGMFAAPQPQPPIYPQSGQYPYPPYGPPAPGQPPALMNLFGQWCMVYPLPQMAYVTTPGTQFAPTPQQFSVPNGLAATPESAYMPLGMGMPVMQQPTQLPPQQTATSTSDSGLSSMAPSPGLASRQSSQEYPAATQAQHGAFHRPSLPAIVSTVANTNSSGTPQLLAMAMHIPQMQIQQPPPQFIQANGTGSNACTCNNNLHHSRTVHHQMPAQVVQQTPVVSSSPMVQSQLQQQIATVPIVSSSGMVVQQTVLTPASQAPQIVPQQAPLVTTTLLQTPISTAAVVPPPAVTCTPLQQPQPTPTQTVHIAPTIPTSTTQSQTIAPQIAASSLSQPPQPSQQQLPVPPVSVNTVHPQPPLPVAQPQTVAVVQPAIVSSTAIATTTVITTAAVTTVATIVPQPVTKPPVPPQAPTVVVPAVPASTARTVAPQVATTQSQPIPTQSALAPPSHPPAVAQNSAPVIVATGSDGTPSAPANASKVSRESSPKMAAQPPVLNQEHQHELQPQSAVSTSMEDIDSLDRLDQALKEKLFPEQQRAASPPHAQVAGAAQPLPATAPRVSVQPSSVQSQPNNLSQVPQSAPPAAPHQHQHTVSESAAAVAPVAAPSAAPITASTSMGAVPVMLLSTPLGALQNSASAHQIVTADSSSTAPSSVASPVGVAAASKVVFEVGSRQTDSPDQFSAPPPVAQAMVQSAAANNGADSDSSQKSAKVQGRKIFRVNQVKDDPLVSKLGTASSAPSTDPNNPGSWPSSAESTPDTLGVKPDYSEMAVRNAAKQFTQPETSQP